MTDDQRDVDISAIDDLRQQWARYWPSADVDAMAHDLRERTAAAVEAWGLLRMRPLRGGNIALVLADDDVVLKVHPRGHPEDKLLAAESAALAFWSSTGAAVTPYERRDGGLTVLMQRLIPGTNLDAAGVAWEERLDILGALVSRLHSVTATIPSSIAHIGGEYSRDWRRVLGDSALLDPAEDDVVLHADLHGANAVRHGSTWRAIDPHAIRGDRHADIWALIDPLALIPPDVPTAASWLRRYATAAKLDPARAAAWVVFRARAEALIGADGDFEWAARLHRTADVYGRLTHLR